MSRVNPRVLMTLYQIFRCWTVYNRSWRIAILPLLLLLYNISILLVTAYFNAIYTRTPSVPGPHRRWPIMMVSYYAATIAINIYATCK